MAPDPLAEALAAIDKIPDAKMREVVVREFYQAYKDDPRLWGDAVRAEPVQPRRLGTIISVRLSSDLAAALRERADALGVSLSDLIRHAADEFIRPTGLRCEHMGISGSFLQSATCPQGCSMQPTYASR
jgi:hypothetical protein